MSHDREYAEAQVEHLEDLDCPDELLKPIKDWIAITFIPINLLEARRWYNNCGRELPKKLEKAL